MSKKLSIQDLLAIPDASDETLDVEIPGYGTITIQALSLSKHREMREESFKGDKFDEARWYTLLLKHGIVEPELSFDDAAAMAKKRVGLVDDILASILQISGLTRAGNISKEAVDESEESFRQE